VYYFAQKYIKFHPQPSRFQKFSRRETPGLLGRKEGWEGIKRFLPLEEGRERKDRGGERDWRGKGGGSNRGSCSEFYGG